MTDEIETDEQDCVCLQCSLIKVLKEHEDSNDIEMVVEALAGIMGNIIHSFIPADEFDEHIDAFGELIKEAIEHFESFEEEDDEITDEITEELNVFDLKSAKTAGSA